LAEKAAWAAAEWENGGREQWQRRLDEHNEHDGVKTRCQDLSRPGLKLTEVVDTSGL
jgi:hypothetical protein